MMVKRSRPLIEAPRVPRVRKSKSLEIQMVAELVTERAQEGAIGRDLLPHCRSHPQADHRGLGIVVAEEFCRPVFTHSLADGLQALGHYSSMFYRTLM